MGLAQRVTTPMTVDEFRTWADRQPGRWELVDGQPRAMSPASRAKNATQQDKPQAMAEIFRPIGTPGAWSF